MKKYLALLLSLVVVSCAPAPAVAQGIERVEHCAQGAYRWSLIVKYKDAGVFPHDVVDVVAPRLNLPVDWESIVEDVVTEIYKYDLTREEVFSKLYLQCIAKETI